MLQYEMECIYLPENQHAGRKVAGRLEGSGKDRDVVHWML